MLFDKEQLKRMKLYNAGLTDKEIADKLKVPINSIRLWRKVYNLKKNKKGDDVGDKRNKE